MTSFFIFFLWSNFAAIGFERIRLSTAPYLQQQQQKFQPNILQKQQQLQINILQQASPSTIVSPFQEHVIEKRKQTRPANTNTRVPLENVANLLGAAANVLPSTSTNAEIEDSSKSKKKQAGANPSGIRRGRKTYLFDANGNKIRPEKENKETGQKQKKSKK